jgi:tetratricopeptide (TPR) repeat protein
MRKSIWSLSLLLSIFSYSSLFAQGSNEQITKAFSDSYTSEYAGKYDAAINALKQVYDDNSYEMNLRLGWLNYSAGKFTDAAAYYQKAMVLLPMSVEARFGAVLPLAALGKWEQVSTIYEEILKIDPKNTTANYRQGLIHYGKNKFETASKYFQHVVNLYPFDYDALLMLGWANYKQAKLREARVYFQKCLLVRPADKSATEALALIK